MADDTSAKVRVNRRAALAVLAGAALPFGAPAAAPVATLELATEDGSPIRNFAIDGNRDLQTLPGVVIAGAAEGDITLVELFDYNCGYCRRAAIGLDELLKGDGRLRLMLVNNPVLSVASGQVARVQQGVLHRYGQTIAYDFHKRVFATHNFVDGEKALEVAREMGLDADPVAVLASRREVETALADQRRFAVAAGLKVVPTFLMAGSGFVGWPGEITTQKMIAAARQCGRLRCAA